MLSLPSNSEETVFISSPLFSRDNTSQTEPVTRNPLDSHWLKHPLSSASFLEHVCTVAPKPANSSTIAYLKEKKKKHITLSQYEDGRLCWGTAKMNKTLYRKRKKWTKLITEKEKMNKTHYRISKNEQNPPQKKQKRTKPITE